MYNLRLQYISDAPQIYRFDFVYGKYKTRQEAKAILNLFDKKLDNRVT